MKTKRFVAGLAALFIFASVFQAQAAETYIRFGEGYLISLDDVADNGLAIGNSAGTNVTMGQYIRRNIAIQGEYASYMSGPSAGLLTLHLDLNDASDKSFDPFINIGAGFMDYRLLGVGGAVKLGMGLNYSFQPSFSPKLTLGFESSLVRGTGIVRHVLYMSNALMLGLHF